MACQAKGVFLQTKYREILQDVGWTLADAEQVYKFCGIMIKKSGNFVGC